MNKIEKILDLYTTLTTLKTVPRTGWLYWNVKDAQIETIGEHVYGTICLALSIYANEKMDIDIQKVVMMLALHETEEIYIGDITPYDKERGKTKKIDGRKAVEKVFNNSDKKEYLLKFIEEFEEGKTKESIFAHQVDKLEADLQARKYNDNVNFETISPKVKNDEKIMGMKKNGLEKISEFFLENDFPIYEGITKEIAQYLKDNK